jgi:hypothetical protein
MVTARSLYLSFGPLAITDDLWEVHCTVMCGGGDDIYLQILYETVLHVGRYRRASRVKV